MEYYVAIAKDEEDLHIQMWKERLLKQNGITPFCCYFCLTEYDLMYV